MKSRFFFWACFLWVIMSAASMISAKKGDMDALKVKIEGLVKGMTGLTTKMDKITDVDTKINTFNTKLVTLSSQTGNLIKGMDNKITSLSALGTSWGNIAGLETKFGTLNKNMDGLHTKIDKLVKVKATKSDTLGFDSCKELKRNTGTTQNGKYNLLLHNQNTPVYCDMANDGWTLVARFSNADGTNWMAKSGYWWYDGIGCAGSHCASYSHNSDMRNTAFSAVTGNDLKITRSDDPTHKALLTASNCLGEESFRTKITTYGNFRNGAVWSSNKCLGTCSITYGPGAYRTTSGFAQHSCSSNIQRSNKIGFWCDWGIGDGAVIMIGGGGSSCKGADHGLGITEENAAKFGGSSKKRDFGNKAEKVNEKGYSLNIWVK